MSDLNPTVFSQTEFLDTERLRYLENGELRAELDRLLEGMKADIESHGRHSEVFHEWQLEIAWVLREGQCRRVDEENTLYDADLANTYRTNIYGRRK
jgi:hypothetical protein